MNHFENEELEQMREQLQLLKDKLAHEHIINDKVLRRAVRDKLSSVQRRSIEMTLLGAVAVPLVTISLITGGFSHYYTILTTAFLILAVVVELYTMNLLRNRDLMSGDLLSAGVKAARVKKIQQQWLMVGIPFVAVWLGWGAYELHEMFPNPEEFRVMLISGVVGGVIGGIIGSVIFYRNQRELSEIIDQIEDLTDGEKL